MSTWPKVRLGEVLSLIDSAVPTAELNEINLAGVYSFARGLFKRGPMAPADTTYKYFNRLVVDDFVISVPKAWEGAIARVTPEFDGWFLSPVFPTFRANRDRLFPPFLEWYCRREPVWAELQRKSRGIGARRESVHPDQFLSLEIPLPSLEEQRWVVARIEELAAQIHEVRTLRQQIAEELSALLMAIIRNSATTPTPMRELMTLRSPEVLVQQNETYQFAGVYSFGRGVFKGALKSGADFAYPKLSKLRSGDFVYPKLMAWEGAFGVTPTECDGCVVSTEFPVFEINRARVKPEVLDVYFRDPSVWASVAGGSIGTNARRRRLNPTDLLEYKFPLPSALVQESVAKVCSELEVSKRLQTEQAAELDALLPAILDRAFKGELVTPEKAESRGRAKIFQSHSLTRDYVRSVFAAQIVDRMHNDRSFGQVKFQKMLYLCEYHARISEIESSYSRYERGPHDPQLISEVEAKLKRCEWFEEYRRDPKKNSHAYRPLARAGEHRTAFQELWPGQEKIVSELIDLMLNWETDRCERVATLYAAWNDLLLWNEPVTDSRILEEVLKNWHPAKLNIPRPKWQEALDWMRSHALVPSGFGSPTKEAPQAELF